MNPKERQAAGNPAPPATPAAAPAIPPVFAAACRHHQSGRLAEAERHYRQILALDPRHADSLHLLGVIAHQTGRHEAAAGLIGQAIALNPGVAFYYANLSSVLAAQGRPDAAVASGRRAVDLAPNDPASHNALGIALRRAGRPDEAAACFRRAVDLRPGDADARNNLGNALSELGRLDEAVACWRAALERKPGLAEAHNNLGNALKELGRPDEAIACWQRAIALRPDHPTAHGNLGHALKALGRLDEAAACYRRAIACKPDDPDAHTNLAMVLLLQGDLEAGWREFEWRWQSPRAARAVRAFVQPRWRGEAAAGRTLLIHAEQGFGDTLQFCRYAPLAAARGLRVVLEAQQPLVRLLRCLEGVDLVTGQGEALPAFDLHCPMLSLPLAMGTTLATVPSAESYLRADAAQVASWRARLAATGRPGLRIGLAWAGSPVLLADRRRSLAPELLAPLFGVAAVHFVSLQKDGPAAPADFPLTDLMAEMADFADTAALIAGLDLVISVDTAVAHLAAALGRPVWLLDRFDPCWRWPVRRRDSPWYPTLRVYRQRRPGDWEAVIAELAGDLGRRASA